jgi:nitroreductase
MKDLSFLLQHQSIPAIELNDPAPSDSELEQILQAAMSAPDHGGLKPFRFLTIRGDARFELSTLFEQAVKKRNPQADAITVAKQRNKPLRSPLIVVVIASVRENPKVPDVEQILSAGCATQHIQLACSSLGYGSIWLTGDNSYDLFIYEALGLAPDERIIGFVYMGSYSGRSGPKVREPALDITQNWTRPLRNKFAI